jgi:hypothetical protein
LPSAQILDDPVRNFGPRQDELAWVDRLRPIAERAGHAKAAYARFERWLNIGKERLELAVVPFSFLRPSLSFTRAHQPGSIPLRCSRRTIRERAER